MAVAPAGAPGDLEVVVAGRGEPVLVVAHGLRGSIRETRPLAGGLPGTRVCYAARGHGTSPLGGEPVTYDVLARDLSEVARAYAATRALGVSMGAATLLTLLAREPARFERVVLFLPGALDRPRDDEAAVRLTALATALEARDRAAVEALVAAEVPPDLGPAAAAYVQARTAFLLGSPGVAAVLRSLPASPPVPDRSVLASVRADVLVLAQEGDVLHPVQLARDLVAVLPRARLVVVDRPGVVFRERAWLRRLLVSFLGEPPR